MKRVVNYIIIFLIIIAAGLVSGLILFNLIFSTKEVYVPDLRGTDSVTALGMLNDKQLNMVVAGQEYSPTLARNHVISQEPEPNSKVKKKKNIKVVLSLGSRKLVVPDVVGISLREAQMALSQRGLKLSRVSAVYDAEKPRDTVIAQIPPQGRALEKGQDISLLLSAGGEPKSYVMPDLIGKDIKEVAELLEKMGIETGEIKYSEYKGFPPGVVIKQEPTAGYKIVTGNKVGLVLSRESAGSSPNTGTFAMFNYRVPQGGGASKVKIVVENESEAREVFNAVKEAGAQVQIMVRIEGETVARVYLNGELVQEKGF